MLSYYTGTGLRVIRVNLIRYLPGICSALYDESLQRSTVGENIAPT
jgi:hypothetical protein